MAQSTAKRSKQESETSHAQPHTDSGLSAASLPDNKIVICTALMAVSLMQGALTRWLSNVVSIHQL